MPSDIGTIRIRASVNVPPGERWTDEAVAGLTEHEFDITGAPKVWGKARIASAEFADDDRNVLLLAIDVPVIAEAVQADPEPARCPWAILFGTRLTTRCILPAGHEDKHSGRGLPEFPDQRIKWLPGDRREFITDRTDAHTWEAAE